MTFDLGLVQRQKRRIPSGEVVFTSPGTYTWTAPFYVTQVSAVCIGGGGAGQAKKSATRSNVRGGAGGGLGWKNNIPVTPGQTYTIVVGAGALGAVTSSSLTDEAFPTENGGDSYFIDPSVVKGGGGASASANVLYAPGGDYVGQGGGTGGFGSDGDSFAGWGFTGGGGGAGGYTGNGGNPGGSSQGREPEPGQGGAGGGGGSITSGYDLNFGCGAGGGGTGIFGQGTNGTAGSNAVNYPTGGAGGSGGDMGIRVAGTFSGNVAGGQFGGGGAATAFDTVPMIVKGTAGASGAVRIIWGTDREFPSKNVQQS